MKTIMLMLFNIWSLGLTGIKNILWKYKRQIPVKLNVYKDKYFFFLPQGDIAKILFSESHLVKSGKAFEKLTLDKISEHVEKGFTVLDIGANVGMHSMFMSDLVGYSGRVVSFEPNSSICSILKKNLSYNGIKNVHVYGKALGNSTVKLYLVVPKGIQRKNNQGDAWGFVSSEIGNDSTLLEEIEMVKLDNLIPNEHLNRLDFIKIDIEGAELDCLRGGEETLIKFKPTIIFECNERYQERFGYNTFDLLNYLNSLGYAMKQYDHEQWIAIFKK